VQASWCRRRNGALRKLQATILASRSRFTAEPVWHDLVADLTKKPMRSADEHGIIRVRWDARKPADSR